MGVTYKLKDEVVHFIIGQRQSNPLFSCRQLAESVSQKFGLNLSKSSVHDVLKESGIITPRGRKPKNKFEIPQEKKKQIQGNLSQVKLLPLIASSELVLAPNIEEPKNTSTMPSEEKIVLLQPPAILAVPPALEVREKMEISDEYDAAGRIFQKAVLWDLGIFSEENIKESDWEYYLTYCKGVKVCLENNKEFFIDLPLPIERCIRETADGLINNIKPMVVDKVSDEELFKACMEAQTGFKISSVSIVGNNNHILLELSSIVEFKRSFMFRNIVFVENKENNVATRLKLIFFPQIIDNNEVIVNIMGLRGFDSSNAKENIVTLLINSGYANKEELQKAADKLNGMNLSDDQDRLVIVKIQEDTQPRLP